MLPKASRITSSEFKGLKARLTYRGALFDVSAAPAEVTKFACVISKKRIKRAVDRNKAKRKVYTLLHNVHTSSPFFIVVYPTKNILQASHETIKAEIAKAFATL